MMIQAPDLEKVANPPIAIVRYNKPEKIDGPSDAYWELLKNWDENEMSLVKQYKALLLDKNERIIAKISFPRSFDFKIKEIKSIFNPIFDMAKLNGATHLIFGQSRPSNNILPSSFEKEKAMVLKQFSDSQNMPITDLLLLTENSYYSFSRNGFNLSA